MSTPTSTQPESKPKNEPREFGRPIRDIIKDLTDLRPDRSIKTVKKGNQEIAYLPWYKACDILDFYAPGWSYRVESVNQIGNQLVMVASITIEAKEGPITRFASGIEEDEVKGYGDSASNAESMALRRCAAKFGLCRYLYEKK